MSKIKYPLLLVGIALAFSLSAQSTKHQRASEQLIRQNSAAFSKKLVAGDYAAVAAAYTEDAKIMPPNLSIITGTDSIRRFWEPPLGVKNRIVYHKVLPEVIQVEGRLAYDWGYYEGRTMDESQLETPWRGKYLIVWKEVSAGNWKIFLDVWNRAPLEPLPFLSTELPTLFASSAVNTTMPEFGGSFSGDGQTFWFNRSTADRSSIALLETHFENGAWTAPRTPAFADTLYRDIDPWVAIPGGVIFFSSNRPLPGMDVNQYNLWRSSPDGRLLVPLGSQVNSADDEIYGSVTRKGNLYFARFGKSKAKIYRAVWDTDHYQVAQRVEIPVPDTASLSNPAISPDEQYLVFASRDLGGFGGADLFVCYRLLDGNWSVPQNLGPGINSADAEFAPAFSPDGKTLIFTSERPGVVQDFSRGQRRPGDIYLVKWDPRASDEKAIRSLQQQYVDHWLGANVEEILGLFEPTARITPSGLAPIDSIQHIRSFWFPKDGSTTIIHAFDNQIQSLEIEGNLAYSAQKTRLHWSYKKGPVELEKIQHGYAHTVYRRQADGQWKIWRQAWTDVGSWDTKG